MPDPLTDKRFGPADSSRAARVLGTLFTAVWLLYLIQPVAGLFEHHHSALYIGISAADSGSSWCSAPFT